MKVVIFAGGFGTRITEDSAVRPKPMIEIGGRPMLWHIMKLYSAYGFNDFVICLGYRGYVIKEYFSNYFLHMSDVTFHLRENRMEVHRERTEPWNVTLVDTGLETMTGGRLLRIAPYIQDDACFALTYGDGVADLDLNALREFHENHGKLATVTAVRPLARFGALDVGANGAVSSFREKPPEEGGWINGGFFMLSPKVLEKIDGDQTLWEREPVERLAQEGQMMAFRHEGFWQPMDTLRDKNTLEALWQAHKAPWKIWE